ncbi:MAG: SpoVA/SpoVAEb family sporulation membrane protein, partial [Clostridiales bacterium]
MTQQFLGEFFRALLVGGSICVIGQLLMDMGKLTPAHT